MKEITVYKRVPVEQEPEKTDRYYTDCSNSPILIWRKIHGWHKYEYIEKIGKIDIVKYHPLFYLKPISLTEYMVGFAEWLSEREIYFDRGFYFQGSHCDDPPLDPVKLFEIYIKEKGGVILQ